MEKDKSISPEKIQAMMRDAKLKEKTGVSRWDEALTPKQLAELKQWTDYLGYDDLLEERANLILEIDAQRNILKNLKINQEEYKGGLANYRALHLNTSYHTLSKLLDTFLGFITASILYGGLKIWKAPSLWIYFASFSVTTLIISIYEKQRYKSMKRRL